MMGGIKSVSINDEDVVIKIPVGKILKKGSKDTYSRASYDSYSTTDKHVIDTMIEAFKAFIIAHRGGQA